MCFEVPRCSIAFISPVTETALALATRLRALWSKRWEESESESSQEDLNWNVKPSSSTMSTKASRDEMSLRFDMQP